MALISLVSAHGAPGTSTTAAALAHHLGVVRGVASVVLEADPDGGALAAAMSMSPTPGLSELAAAARAGLEFHDVERCSQRLSEHTDAVLGQPGLEQTAAALRALARPLAALDWSAAPFDLVVDAGRCRPDAMSLPIVAASDLVLLIVRSTAVSVVAAMHRLELLERSARTVGLVVIGDTPYNPREVGQACGIPVFAELPWTPVVVDRDPLGAMRRIGWRRSKWNIALGALAERVAATCRPSTATVDEPSLTHG